MASAKSAEPIESRRVVKARSTRAQVVEAARGLFERRGFASVTVREIADASGFSTGAMFSGFDGKNALFKAAFPADHQVRRMAEAMCDAYYAAQVWASASPGTRERWMGAATDALARVKADAKKAA